MKVGVIGAGNVGAACVLALSFYRTVREIVVIDTNNARAKGVAADVGFGAGLSPAIDIRVGNYADLKDAQLIMITAGINEKTGGATNKNDPAGRLHLLATNAKIYQEIVPQIIAYAKNAVILVVTDPPDPLADVTRKCAGHSRVVSACTFLDSMRFRFCIAHYLNVSVNSVDAYVLGEHGTSSVFVWSSARVGGESVQQILKDKKEDVAVAQKTIEEKVRFANIDIIAGINASQYGIGMICARITEIILRDERMVIPIGSYNKNFGVTLSLPSVVGRDGVIETFNPTLSELEKTQLAHSAEVLKKAGESVM